jgi:hypothetical protein
MSKLKDSFSKSLLYQVNDSVMFDWLGSKRRGVIESIKYNEKQFPIYFVRADNERLYNMGAEYGLTLAGYILNKVGEAPKTRIPEETVTEIVETNTSKELTTAIKKQKDFLNHFFEN